MKGGAASSFEHGFVQLGVAASANPGAFKSIKGGFPKLGVPLKGDIGVI